MKIMPCPLNGLRNISEFVYGGEVMEMPDICADRRDWAEYVFMRDNVRGLVKEWWMHVPTSYWFIAERNTETDEIVRAYSPTEIFSERVEFKREQ